MSKLNEWRKRQGMKQQAAADFLGITIRALRGYEHEGQNGRTPQFAVRNLIADRTKGAVPADSWDETKLDNESTADDSG